MDQRIIDLYDSFTHGLLDRRSFLERAARIAGSTAAATALLSTLRNNYALAAIVPPDDARLAVSTISFDAAGGKVTGYMARQKEGAAKRPAVLVVHENRGLNPHIEDVTRRLALAGFLALAPDLLSIFGGTPADEEKSTQMIRQLNLDQTVAQLVAGTKFVKSHPQSTGNVGAVGFCWGGGVVNWLATASPDLGAAVVYYGVQPPADKVAQIHAPLLLHYAGLDERVDAGIPAYESALKADHKSYQLYMYPNVNHAFNNDTAGPRYDKEAADLAWGRTVAFLKEHLGGPTPE
jgi:carboxymethylenebutenolidase